MHIRREPSILYFGTPVILIDTLNHLLCIELRIQRVHIEEFYGFGPLLLLPAE